MNKPTEKFGPISGIRNTVAKLFSRFRSPGLPPIDSQFISSTYQYRENLPNKKSSRYLPFIRITLSLGVAFLGILAFLIWDLRQNLNLDSYESTLAPIENWTPNDNTIVLDRSGKVISEEFSMYHRYISYENIPKFLITAVISTEDKRFMSHSGYDLKAIARAALSRVTGSSRYQQGASTITQQVIRGFTLAKEKTYLRKAQEIFLAYKLEQKLSKEKILEIYLNHLFLGNGSYGVGSAAKRYFDKEISQLNNGELALIAGLFQSPTVYNPQKNLKAAIHRQRDVLNALVNTNEISREDAKRIASMKINIVSWSGVKLGFNRWFTAYVTSEARRILKASSIKNQGFVIHTTLDSKLQDAASRSVSSQTEALEQIEQLPTAEGKPPLALEAAFLVVDPRNGEILSMIGGRNQELDFNRTVQARRSPGSLFKPVVYSLALESGLKWSDVFYVSPISLTGNYRPRNSSKDFLSETTMLRSFYRSMNTPTMEIAERLGLPNIIEHAKKLGIKSPIKFEFGSALGQSEATMMEIAQMYSCFANGGLSITPIAITKIIDRQGEIVYEAESAEHRSTQVVNPEIAFLMNQGLKKVLQIGTGSRAGEYASFAGGKTGTTNESKDNWFAGVTSNTVGISWVGADEPIAVAGDAQGATLALPIWSTFIENAPFLKDAVPLQPPDGVQAQLVHPEFGNLSNNGIEMWFLNGNLPDRKGEALEALQADGKNARGFGVK